MNDHVLLTIYKIFGQIQKILNSPKIQKFAYRLKIEKFSCFLRQSDVSSLQRSLFVRNIEKKNAKGDKQKTVLAVVTCVHEFIGQVNLKLALHKD